MPNRRETTLALGLVPLTGLLAACGERMLALGPASVANGLVLQRTAQGERLALITSQWERSIYYPAGRTLSTGRSSTPFLFLDYWLFDTAAAQPLHRVRLVKARQLGDVAVLGADRGVLWVRTPQLMGVRMADGAVVADRARVAAANPALATMLPVPQAATFVTEQQQRLRFDEADGLVILLDDGRRARVDALTLQATLLSPTRDTEKTVADPLRRRAQRLTHGMKWGAMVRGVTIARSAAESEWLGLAAERELAQIQRDGHVASTPDFNRQDRFKLHRGRIRAERTWMGTRQKLELIETLPEAPEFLFAGLAAEDADAQPARALWRREPDSVFVLHRDRLGDAGRWLLSRIAGPRGRELWRAELPLSGIELWSVGERHALLVGRWLNGPRSTMAEAREEAPLHIVSVDLASGAVAAFNLDVERGWPSTPAPAA